MDLKFYRTVLHPACVSCLLKKQIDVFPEHAPREQVLRYMRRMGDMVANLPSHSNGPEMMDRILSIQKDLFGQVRDYTDIKRHFNSLMLGKCDRMTARICSAPDPLYMALGYSMTGNFIDFGAMDHVSEDKLNELLDHACDALPSDRHSYEALKVDLATAERLVLLADNCGEIVCDKMLLATIRALYPTLNVTVLVRGEPILNDATMDDARQIALDSMPGVTVIGNGDRIAGTALSRISNEALRVIEKADVILSKGQGNFETLQGCGLNIYYLFMCKCHLFADRFGVPLYSGMLINDRDFKED